MYRESFVSYLRDDSDGFAGQLAADLEVKLLEGLKSSRAALTAADWKEIRAEALAKVAVRKKLRGY